MLYMQVIVHTRSISCIRDITPKHLPLLKSIRRNAERAAFERYGIETGELRMFVHYQPSFCEPCARLSCCHSLINRYLRTKITSTSTL